MLLGQLISSIQEGPEQTAKMLAKREKSIVDNGIITLRSPHRGYKFVGRLVVDDVGQPILQYVTMWNAIVSIYIVKKYNCYLIPIFNVARRKLSTRSSRP